MKQFKCFGSISHFVQYFYKITLILAIIALVLFVNYFAVTQRHCTSGSVSLQPNFTGIEVCTQFVTTAKVKPVKYKSDFGKIVLQRRLYGGDPACNNFAKRLYARNTFQPTPLVSFPGSGNTWVRHLLELASGIYTGSIYNDVELLAHEFLGEKEDADAGSTVVQKMHINYSKGLNVSRAILIIRNPYKAIVSFAKYLQSGHLGQGGSTTFRKKGWELYFLKKTFEWCSIAKSWIESPVNLLVLYYEHLLDKAQRHHELEKVCRFLEIRCDNLKTICFSNHEEGLFHRRHIVGKLYFPTWVRTKVDAGISFLNTVLEEYGFEGIPLSKYEHFGNIL